MSTVLVDRRTGSKDLYALLPRGHAELTDLEFADAVVTGNGPNGPETEAFERKRLSDSLQCIQTRRYAGRQLRGLLRDYDYVWLVIEDEIRAHPQTGILQRVVERKPLWRKRGGRMVIVGEEVYWADALFGNKSTIMWRDFQHWVVSMHRKGGTHTIAYTRNAQETANLIWTVHTWRQKKWEAHKSVDVLSPDTKRAPGRPRLFSLPLVAEVAGRYDGIGYDKALAISEHFRTPHDFISATVAELQAVDGIGRKLAESIVRQSNERRTK